MIIVEDGTGLVNAESYVSVADATVYHNNIGNAAWSALANDEIREQLLRKATAFMLQRYRSSWNGWRKTTTQSLDWPRSLVQIKDAVSLNYYDDASVPELVKNACSSLALRASTQILLADEKRAKSSVTIGPISTTYDPFSSQSIKYKEIDTMLSPYFNTTGFQVRMVRG